MREHEEYGAKQGYPVAEKPESFPLYVDPEPPRPTVVSKAVRGFRSWAFKGFGRRDRYYITPRFYVSHPRFWFKGSYWRNLVETMHPVSQELIEATLRSTPFVMLEVIVTGKRGVI